MKNDKKKEENESFPPSVDPRLCCAAQICCDNPEDAREALASLLQETIESSTSHGDTDKEVAETLADWVLDNFDLVPKGTATSLYKNLRPWFESQRKSD